MGGWRLVMFLLVHDIFIMLLYPVSETHRMVVLNEVLRAPLYPKKKKNEVFNDKLLINFDEFTRMCL